MMMDPANRKTGDEASPYRPGLVAALDIGTSKVACLIARVEPVSMRVLGAALRESRGLRSGTVVNLPEAEEAIAECVDAAESMADVDVQNVLISVNCGGPVNLSAKVAMNVGGALISDAHLRPLLAEARARCSAEDYETIQSAPRGYTVDDAAGVHNPSGMYCQHLEVAMHAVAVRRSPLANLKLAVENRHLQIAGALFSAYASGLSVLTPDEMQLGATVIDMGGGTTSIAVFMDGGLVFVDVVPLGGVHVTGDLARMLGVPMSEAERAKVLYGAALGDLETGAPEADEVLLRQLGEESEENTVKVQRSMLTRIIQARLDEIFGEVQARLRNDGFDVVAGRQAVLTGGASQLAGVRELASRALNKQVRLAHPTGFPGLPESAAGPGYACAAGLVMAGATLPPEFLNPEMSPLSPSTDTKSWLFRLTGGLLG
jgi:cell division protein FtsA